MKWVVTGGCGFIGTNLVAHLIERGDFVVLIDNLSRKGSEINAQHLNEAFGVEPIPVDISNAADLEAALGSVGNVDAVAHLAGQVSFLASLEDPRRDFEVNALGTLNLLEWVRRYSPEAALIGMSSNKVYGDLDTLQYQETESRYVLGDFPSGLDESLPLDFRGPYGCSKGAADQYLVDYGRMYGLRTVSLRQSSVYGPHQHPRSDQGWVAHLLTEAKQGHVIQLNGVGKQVRDLLHASDLANLIRTLGETLASGGVAVNVGGGTGNDMSILELFAWIQEHTGTVVRYNTGDSRPSDQRVFISDNTLVSSMTGWAPEVPLKNGLETLWVSA